MSGGMRSKTRCIISKSYLGGGGEKAVVLLSVVLLSVSLSLSVSVSPFDRPHGCENLAGECHQEQQVQGSIFFFWKSARVG